MQEMKNEIVALLKDEDYRTLRLTTAFLSELLGKGTATNE